MCTEVTEFFFHLTHHEMGHIQYYMNYKDLPLLEQSAPSPGKPLKNAWVGSNDSHGVFSSFPGAIC